MKKFAKNLKEAKTQFKKKTGFDWNYKSINGVTIFHLKI